MVSCWNSFPLWFNVVATCNSKGWQHIERPMNSHLQLKSSYLMRCALLQETKANDTIEGRTYIICNTINLLSWFLYHTQQVQQLTSFMITITSVNSSLGIVQRCDKIFCKRWNQTTPPRAKVTYETIYLLGITSLDNVIWLGNVILVSLSLQTFIEWYNAVFSKR